MTTAFSFAQARMQSRHGDRPDAAVWRNLHAHASLAHFIEAARATSLGCWMPHLHAQLGAHELERALGHELALFVAELASWMPERWRPALLWTRELPAVAPVQGETPLTVEQRREWTARFRALLPPLSHGYRAGFAALEGTLATHIEQMERSDSDGWALRARLELDFARLFRQYPEQPAAAYIFLALNLLDLERLRGGLLRRKLFPDVRSEVQWV